MRARLFSRRKPLRLAAEILLPAGLIVACLCATQAFGQTQVNDSWTAVGSGTWSNATNWSSGVPNNNSSPLYDVSIENGTSTNASVVNLDISPTINNLTLASNNSLLIPTTQTLTIAGSNINNGGTISSGVNAGLQLVIAASNVALAGAGALHLSNNSNNTISALLAGNTLTNNATIEGSGTVGGGSLVLNNSGSVIANQVTPLIINIIGTDTNSGVLQAYGGGTLEINGGIIQNSGSIQSNIPFTNADRSTLVVINNATINGGSLSASVNSGGGNFGIVQLNNVTLNGTAVAPAAGTTGTTLQFNGNTVINGGA